jgi:exonuclease III
MGTAATCTSVISSSALPVPASFPKLTFSIQNCNSLNVSTVCDKQLTKIASICSLDTDIIFLSDLRLNSDAEHIEKIEKLFLYNKNRSYIFLHNSSKNSRGVGILLSASLDPTITDRKIDNSENILKLTVTVRGHSFNIISIYGPNKDDKSFFSDLSNILSEDNHTPVIIGGDWNATMCSDNSKDNIDIFRMSGPPSVIRSNWINTICEELHLCDPFRSLHPTKRDFTFIPKGAKSNRSRIDFFLISANLLCVLAKCCISPSLSNSLFDHKHVTLDFRSEKIVTKMYINRTIINHPRTGDVVAAAVADTYLAHARDDQPRLQHALPQRYVFRAEEGTPLQNQKVIVGNLLRTINEYNDLCMELEVSGYNHVTELRIAGLNTVIKELREQLWDDATFSQLELSCEHDSFLEVLLSNVKGSVISFQTWVKKKDNVRKNMLIKKIHSLKSNYAINAEEISLNENLLNEIINKEVVAKVKSMKIFECLNAEKPTPMFLNLARVSNSDKKLASVCDPGGLPFKSDMARNEYIVSYYEDLYRKPLDEPLDLSGCIENFLGPEVCSSHIVENSKLSNAERDGLDSPLTIAELDRSMEGANMKSAPGIDGISNVFLKEFWHHFRWPLLRYCECCFAKGSLTQNFRGANIKLIPKKGEITSLGNWRPISLLSNVYKVISRAMNNRLNSVVNRICSRSQKGFNDKRYTQECLINVIESISHCNSAGVPGAVVAVDMAKAFRHPVTCLPSRGLQVLWFWS